MTRAVFLAFLRAGLLGFGGGAALAPAMHREAVERYGWVSDEAFGEILALSNTLPGPAAPQMAAVIGYQAAGMPGALAAVAALVLPMTLTVVVLISWIFAAVGESAYRLLLLKKATVGIFPLVAAMVGRLVTSFFRKGGRELGAEKMLLLSAVTFLLIDDGTYGPVEMPLAINNAYVILTMIYLAMTNAAPWTKLRKRLALFPAGLFLFSQSGLALKLGWVIPFPAKIALVLLLLGLAVAALAATPPCDGNGDALPSTMGTTARDLARLWAVVLPVGAGLVLLSPLLRQGAFLGLMGGMVFTGLMTFGGGPVFIPLAIDLLAGPRSPVFLYSQERLMQYFAIINSLPSPIVTKLAAISGFDMIRDLAGVGIADNGVSTAVTGLSPAAVTVWAALGGLLMVVVMVLPGITNSLLAYASFDRLKRSPAMQAMSLYILPVLIAIFVSVLINFLRTSSSTIGTFPGRSYTWGVGQTALLFAVFWTLQRMKRRIPDGAVIVAAMIWGLLVL